MTRDEACAAIECALDLDCPVPLQLELLEVEACIRSDDFEDEEDE